MKVATCLQLSPSVACEEKSAPLPHRTRNTDLPGSAKHDEVLSMVILLRISRFIQDAATCPVCMRKGNYAVRRLEYWEWHAHLLDDIIFSLGALLPLALHLCTGCPFDPHVLQLSLHDRKNLPQSGCQPARCSGRWAFTHEGDEPVMYNKAHCTRFLVLQTINKAPGYGARQLFTPPKLRNACRTLRHQHHRLHHCHTFPMSCRDFGRTVL